MHDAAFRQPWLTKSRGRCHSEARSQRIFAFEIGNARAEPVVVELAQDMADGQGKVTAETQPHTMDRGSAIWRFTIAPGARVQMRLSLDMPN